MGFGQSPGFMDAWHLKLAALLCCHLPTVSQQTFIQFAMYLRVHNRDVNSATYIQHRCTVVHIHTYTTLFSRGFVYFNRESVRCSSRGRGVFHRWYYKERRDFMRNKQHDDVCNSDPTVFASKSQTAFILSPFCLTSVRVLLTFNGLDFVSSSYGGELLKLIGVVLYHIHIVRGKKKKKL